MKKRSIKKVLALGLAGAMLCGMLTACGGANGSSSAPSASSEGQAEPAAPETEKEKVVLWHLWTGVEAGYLDDAVAAYNAQSDKYYVEADKQHSNAGIRAARATERTAKQAQPALAQTG